ncbi:MAG: ABC transporter substrate-binding protein [Actinomycetota bacterium]
MKDYMTGRRWWVLAAILALVAAACGGGAAVQPTTAPPATESPATPTSVYDVSLAGICPDKIVLQTDWFPEVEHGAAYNLIGPGGQIDAERGTYSGEIKDTGVQMEIRAGGPFIGFQPPVGQMYSDPEITLAYADTGDAIRNSGSLPTVAIVAPLQKSPQILMFDPATYDFQTVTDVKASGATVAHFEGSAFMEYLLGTGQLDPAQIDGSYDGSPARFVAEGGALVQQGFATNEPYKYANDIPEWGKPVDFLLLFDAGWTIYQSPIVVRPDDLGTYRSCWEKLVPMWQQSQVDYITNPAETNQVILDVVVAMNTFWTLSPELNDYAVQAMLDLGIISNGPDGTLGSFDLDRVQTLIDELVPIFQADGVDTMKEGVAPEDIVTNEFIDPSIGL